MLSLRRAAVFILALAVCAATYLNARPATAPDQLEVVGPSVLLNARDAGKVNIVDLRKAGRAVPGATVTYRDNGAPLFLLGNENSARSWARQHRIAAAFIVPPHFIEYQKLPGVPQISPRLANSKTDWPLFDISEASEWARSRLPRSQRFDYARFRAGDWAQLPQGRPFLIICRVGHRSQLVVQELRRHGYDARNVDGGLWQWECDGLKVTR